MATQRDRKRRKSARVRAEARKVGFESKSIRLPEGVSFWQIDKAGVKSVDIMPFIAGVGNPYADKGEVHFERTYWTHRSVGSSGDTYVCPKKTAGKRCPICEYRTELTKDPNADEELIKDLAPKERQLWLLYDLADVEKGLQVWDVSFHLFGKALDARIKNSDEEDEYEYFFELDNGKTLKLGMEEKSWAGNTYYEVASIDFKSRKKAYDVGLLEELPSLDDMIIIPSYNELKKVFLQIEEGADDDDDESDGDDEPVAKQRSIAESRKAKREEAVMTRRPKPAPVEEDTVDEDDDIPFDDEEDEVDEPPPTKPAKSQKTDKKHCVACDDTKVNSKGKPCPACTRPASPPATATRPKPAPVATDDDDDGWDDDEPVPVKPKATAAKTEKVSTKKSFEDTDDWDANWDD